MLNFLVYVYFKINLNKLFSCFIKLKTCFINPKIKIFFWRRLDTLLMATFDIIIYYRNILFFGQTKLLRLSHPERTTFLENIIISL